MADDLPNITLGYDDAGSAVVFVELDEAPTAEKLVGLAPSLCQPGNATLCAQAVNHLAHDQTFTVIEDPNRFAEWFRQRREAESPGDQWKEGGFQLRNYEVPDLGSIAPPTITGDTLVFYAVNRQIGAPYQVTASLDALGSPDYAPMPPGGEK